MRPAVPHVLESVILGLEKQIAALPPGPEQAAPWVLKTLISLVHRDWDDAVSLRASEIETLISLLRRSAALAPLGLQTSLLFAVEKAEEGKRDLRVSALESTLDGLRHALIELQAWLETSSDPQAAALLQESWAFLVKGNQRRYADIKPW